ncbi:hypothetical protein DFJ58DRAFT_848166 [Suillus subalutaceus]|uniref:uncharacterized protein n=1 Tax=Suillus subalutaceus TaxID=48586 RepID=UPI001B873268|nr:uncharacterized protein DFJ58DRAFT_848166 [Suillus subalutaceus]KAG1831675.1 hypothetical protein DFJ58DRAFT_848166 [Suillus subalutaceus]
MPQPYVLVAACQNAAHQPPAPVVPSAVPQVHMPEPSIPPNNQDPAMPVVTGRQDPVVPPPPVMTNVHPKRDTAFPPPIINDTHYVSQSQPTARAPEPHVDNRRATPGPVIPDMTSRRGDPVVSPPVITDAQRAANSLSRPRITDFYQPADRPISMPEPYLSDVPFRHQRSFPYEWQHGENPLLETYGKLPHNVKFYRNSQSLNVEHMENMLAQPAGPISRLGNLFGSSSERKGKSDSFALSALRGAIANLAVDIIGSNAMTLFVISPAAAVPHGINPYTGSGAPLQVMPVPDRGPTVKVLTTGNICGSFLPQELMSVPDNIAVTLMSVVHGDIKADPYFIIVQYRHQPRRQATAFQLRFYKTSLLMSITVL